MNRFDGKSVLLVGGASGIGRATAQAFGKEGAAVCVADINDDGGRETTEHINAKGGKAWFVHVDVRGEDEVKRMVNTAVELLGGLDVLVNVAGVLRVDVVERITVEDWNLTFEVNVRGPFLTVKYALEALRRGRDPAIVNIGSAAGFKDGAGSSAYSASKGAVIAFSKTMAMELAEHNIRVNAMCPGFIDTPFNDPAYEFMGGREAVDRFVQEGIPLRRMGTPEEAAAYILFLAAPESSFVTGQAVLMDGGMI
jgi:NAD(P)-dependent dehydrogenase (short-subunit alcohol dehydrogenase family)